MYSLTAPPIEYNDTTALLNVLKKFRKIMFWGDMGVGKSTLAVQVLHLAATQSPLLLLELDPGTPPFGVPGTICSARIHDNEILRQHMRPLCTLNSGRFRLPLLYEAQKLLISAEKEYTQPTVLIDPPGVVRGVAGAELLMALATSFELEAILLLSTIDTIPLAHELDALNVQIFPVTVSAEAKNPTTMEKARKRTQLWDQFLRQAVQQQFDMNKLPRIGTPPPLSAPEAWPGRQLAILDSTTEVIGMGEVVELTDMSLTTRLVQTGTGTPHTVLVRDAARNEAGLLATSTPHRQAPHRQQVPTDRGIPHTPLWDRRSPPLSCRVGEAWATLVGGIFGDPLLHVRLRNQKRSFFFDLGDPRRLQAKIAHQVEAVFLSHAHLDHIGGFLWFLRCRIGLLGPCKIFGPAGITQRIIHFIRAITWDRIDDLGPVFEVGEILDAKIVRTRLQPGKSPVTLAPTHLENSMIMRDTNLSIRAVICDHNIPCIAYALEFAREISIRKDRLVQLGLPPGPWLGHLKECIASNSLHAVISLPDGSKVPAEKLANELSFIRAGKKLAYIADMADTVTNRDKAINLASGAHTLFCEAAFTSNDQEKATATQHLTTTAAAHIARTAGVQQLVPFHFSKRYESAPHRVYQELRTKAAPIHIIGSSMPEPLTE